MITFKIKTLYLCASVLSVLK